MSALWPPEVVLAGEHARLVPLEKGHVDALAEASADGDLSGLWYTGIAAPPDMAADVERRLGLRADGSCLPFAVLDATSGVPLGMTTYMNIDAANRRVEIGATWYRASAQRTAVNTECKFMLLRHAFEDLGCIAVEFRTHFFNHASRRAIERLGAKLDGIFRSHSIGRAGELRDTCVYSIVASEWPAVRAHLGLKMARRRGAPAPGS